MSHFRIATVVALLTVAAGPALAQTKKVAWNACAATSMQPDYGFDGIDCVNCEISGRGQPWIVFHAEPRIREVRANGPADGKLRAGDTLVSIDGMAITTRAGAERYAAVKPGETIEFKVRRGGIVTTSITAGSRCLTKRESPFFSFPLKYYKPTVKFDTVVSSWGEKFKFVPESMSFLPESISAKWSRAVLTYNTRGWVGIGLVRDTIWKETPIAKFDRLPEIAAVAPGSPAQVAGIATGDTLVAVDGLSFLTPEGSAKFFWAPAGASMDLTLQRNGQRRVVTIVTARPPVELPAAGFKFDLNFKKFAPKK